MINIHNLSRDQNHPPHFLGMWRHALPAKQKVKELKRLKNYIHNCSLVYAHEHTVGFVEVERDTERGRKEEGRQMNINA